MYEIDVYRYYGLAADNFQYVLELGQKLLEALRDPSNFQEPYRSGTLLSEIRADLDVLLRDPEVHDAMAVFAAVHGLGAEETFSPVVLELQNRHFVRNKFGRLFRATNFLTSEAEIGKEIARLREKMKERYTKI